MKKIVLLVVLVLVCFNLFLQCIGYDGGHKSFHEVLVILSSYNNSFTDTLDSISSSLECIENLSDRFTDFVSSYHENYSQFSTFDDVLDSFSMLSDFSDILVWLENFCLAVWDLLLFIPTVFIFLVNIAMMCVELLVYLLPAVFSLVVDIIRILTNTLRVAVRLIT